ncbi:MAG: methionyl-tRNA formyltransferase, partial [Bdellovibrionota bacterium]
MSKVRILFLGTPEFAASSLRRLIADDHFEIVGVITQPDRPAGRKMQLKASPVKELALLSGLRVFSPETVNTEEFRNEIALLRAESAAVVAFGQILGQKFLDLFPKGAVNVHGSILPRWRGAAPIQRAVMAGDEESGVTLQIIVRKLDAGPLLGERRLKVPDDMNALELHDSLKDLGAELLLREYFDYLRGHLNPVPQDEALVTIAAKIDKAEALIDWSLPAKAVHDKVRGLQMGP